MNRKWNALIIVLLVLMNALPAHGLVREQLQQKKDQALIEAIKAGDDKKGLKALAEGASGEARDTGEPPTFREALLHLLDHFRNSEKDSKNAVSALLLLLHVNYQGVPFHDQIHVPNPEVIRALLDHGAQVNDRDNDGLTPLGWALTSNDNKTFTLLLERGANIEKVDDQGCTMLIGANAAATRMLLEHGANIEAIDNDKETALIYAASLPNVEVVRILLEHGAKVVTEDSTGMTALGHAMDNMQQRPDPDFSKVEALLRQHGAK